MTQVISSEGNVFYKSLTAESLDLVIWDSHPLALGAAPKQVFIDGIAQLKSPHVSRKPTTFQHVPKTPDFTKERADALKYEGLPPLEPKKAKSDVVMFTNVKSILLRQGEGVREAFSSAKAGESGVIVFKRGEVSCVGTSIDCSVSRIGGDPEIIDLEGGSIS